MGAVSILELAVNGESSLIPYSSIIFCQQIPAKETYDMRQQDHNLLSKSKNMSIWLSLASCSSLVRSFRIFPITECPSLAKNDRRVVINNFIWNQQDVLCLTTFGRIFQDSGWHSSHQSCLSPLHYYCIWAEFKPNSRVFCFLSWVLQFPLSSK